jgi:hypothetical protein
MSGREDEILYDDGETVITLSDAEQSDDPFWRHVAAAHVGDPLPSPRTIRR